MISQSHHNMSSPYFSELGRHNKISILQKNSADTDDEYSYSAEELNCFLAELTLLAGQGAPGTPVLELQIGEIFTRTAVEMGGTNHYLSVTALLPRCQPPHYLPLPFPVRAETSLVSGTAEFLWHADEGCYIVMRKIPVAELPDGFSVMDAILQTSDLASICYSSINAGSP